MKRLLSLSLLLLSLACYPKSKISICGYTTFLDNPDTVMVHFKDESYKKVSIEDFRANYIYKPLPIGPNTTVVSGTSEAPCLGGVIFLTDSKYDADYVIRETTRNDYGCTMRIVNRSSMGCDEWQITTDRGYADHKVYISKDVSNYDYKVRIIR